MRCYHCANEIVVEGTVSRQQTCPRCHSYLHCCLNCEFYDARAFHQCRESEAEWVKEKESGNFCVHFTPRKPGGNGDRNDRGAEARRKLDELFGKKSPSDQ